MYHWEEITFHSKNVDSHSASDKERVPQTHLVKCSYLRITVMRGIHFPEDWVLYSSLPGLDLVPLGVGNDLVAAKKQALKLVENRLAEMTQDLEDISDA